MSSNVMLFGWNRPIPGQEKVSAQHFEEFVQYLGACSKMVRFSPSRSCFSTRTEAT